MVPRIGPIANGAKAQFQPTQSTQTGISWIVTSVRAKPAAVWVVSMVPVRPGGDNSLTQAENWADSAITEMPQTMQRARTSAGAAPKTNPARRQQAALIMEIISQSYIFPCTRSRKALSYGYIEIGL